MFDKHELKKNVVAFSLLTVSSCLATIAYCQAQKSFSPKEIREIEKSMNYVSMGTSMANAGISDVISIAESKGMSHNSKAEKDSEEIRTLKYNGNTVRYKLISNEPITKKMEKTIKPVDIKKAPKISISELSKGMFRGRGMTVVIDAGHGGNDPGESSKNVLEKNLNLDISKKVRDKLSQSGLKIIMTRENDKYVSLGERARIANNNNAQLVVSIHCDASEKADTKGPRICYYPPVKKEKKYDFGKVAPVFQKELMDTLEIEKITLLSREKLVVLNSTVMPAVLVECGFLTNDEERKKLQNEEYRNEIAEGIARGIVETLRKVK